METEQSHEVREVREKVVASTDQARRNKRLEAQSSRRNISRDDCDHEISEKQVKTLLNMCKTSKLTLTSFRHLSQALSCDQRSEYCQLLLDSEGCLHALVGYLSGHDPAKQVLSIQCLVNLAAQGYKGAVIAKTAGAYLATLLAGTNRTLAEHSCLVISNLCLTDPLSTPVLINLNTVETLINLSTSSTDSVQESCLQALYHLIRTERPSSEMCRRLVTVSLSLMTPPRSLPPVHLLWILFILSSHQSLHNYLANESFLHQCLDIATYEIYQKCDSRPVVKLLTPVVRILANLSAGPDSVSVCLCLLRHQDLATILTSLLSTNYTHLCRETLWLFANIVNNENMKVQEEFVNLDLMDKLETHAVHAVGRLDPYALGGYT